MNISNFIIIVILTIICCSCTAKSNELEEDNSIKKNAIQYSNDFKESEVTEILMLIGDKLLYSEYFEDKGVNGFNYFMQNLSDNEVNFIGEIMYPYLYTNSITNYEDSIFFHMTHNINEGNVTKKLYELDFKDNRIIELQTSKAIQTLSYITSVDNLIYSTKSKIVGEDRISYIEVINIKGELIDDSFIEFNSKDEFILNVDSFNEEIYVLTIKGTDKYIYQYSQEGNRLELYDITMLISEFSTHNISKFEVINECIYIRNFSGEGIIAIIENDNIIPITEMNDGIDIAISYEKEVVDTMMLYNRKAPYLWIFDTNNMQMSKVDLSDYFDFTNLRTVYKSKDNIFLRLKNDDINKSGYFLKYTDLEIIETIDLANIDGVYEY